MNRNRITALFAAALLYFAALYAYVPSLPAYIAGRTSSLTAVGVVLAMYGLWMAFLRMPLGIVTDATGRNKPWLIAGVLMAGIGAVVMALGKTVGVLAAGRALTGVSAAVWVPMMVVFAGFFPPERTIFATSLLSFASSFGQMIGTSCTGFLESWGGFDMAFYAAAGLAVAATVIIAFVRIPRKDAAHRGMVSARSILAIFRRRDVLVPSFTNALCQFGVWAVTFGFMPLLARQIGAGSVAVGLIMTLNIAANMATNLLATLIARQGNRKLLLYAQLRGVRRRGRVCRFRPQRPSPLRLHRGHGTGERPLLPHSPRDVDRGSGRCASQHGHGHPPGGLCHRECSADHGSAASWPMRWGSAACSGSSRHSPLRRPTALINLYRVRPGTMQASQAIR